MKKAFFIVFVVILVSTISFFVIKDSIKKEESKKVKRDWASEIPMNVSRKKPLQRDVGIDLDGKPFYFEDEKSFNTKSKPVTDTTKRYHATYSKPVKKVERRYLTLDELKDSILMAENNKINEKRESKSPPEKAFVYSKEVSTWKISALFILVLSILFFGIGKLMHIHEERQKNKKP